MTNLLNIKSNEALIYAMLGFHVCRKQIDQYQNCKRTGTAGHKSPEQCYTLSKKVHQCTLKNATKIDPISMPIFNDVRECLFQNDSHIYNCKQEINQLIQSHTNPENYKQMLLASTPDQRKPKRYNQTLNPGSNWS